MCVLLRLVMGTDILPKYRKTVKYRYRNVKQKKPVIPIPKSKNIGFPISVFWGEQYSVKNGMPGMMTLECHTITPGNLPKPTVKMTLHAFPGRARQVSFCKSTAGSGSPPECARPQLITPHTCSQCFIWLFFELGDQTNMAKPIVCNLFNSLTFSFECVFLVFFTPKFSTRIHYRPTLDWIPTPYRNTGARSWKIPIPIYRFRIWTGTHHY